MKRPARPPRAVAVIAALMLGVAALYGLTGNLRSALATHESAEVEPFSIDELAPSYFQRLLALLPDKKSKKIFESEDPNLWVTYGLGTCYLLEAGWSEDGVREETVSFYGAGVGNALVEAAIDVLCPHYKKKGT